MSGGARPGAGPSGGSPNGPAAVDRSAARFLGLGAVLGFFGVLAGAFGAHSLRERLAPDLIQVFETAVRYQLVHALALLLVAVLLERRPSRAATAAGWLFVAGTIVFSGSLYALALTGWRILGAVTPLGGLCFLAGWLALALSGIGRAEV
jgi:uncharacterized membrane protein YgdD (TMEM256/DUF423 family)